MGKTWIDFFVKKLEILFLGHITQAKPCIGTTVKIIQFIYICDTSKISDKNLKHMQKCST